MRRALRILVPAALVVLHALLPCAAAASDHADPVMLDVQESDLTDLFVFPDGDRMVFILDVRRSLTGAGPYPAVADYEYRVNIDLHSRLSFDDPARRARFGGTVVDPAGIRPDVVIRLRLRPDGSLGEHSIDGLASTQGVRFYAGVRDDPFIFPRFFGTNVLATVTSIPASAFPAGQQDFVIWGTTVDDDGEQLDHVGRSNRTQNARLDLLNTLPPSRHQAVIHEGIERRNRVYQRLGKNHATLPLQQLYHLVFQLRHYDLAPDVMLYSRRFPPGYPNGRLLTDDVAKLTCDIGDCVLMELSYTESTAFPRATANDKPFLAAFPYLAEPWPPKPQAPGPGNGWLWLALLVLLLPVALVAWLLARWCRRHHRRAGAAPA